MRAYSIVSSLKSNLPDTFEVEEGWVKEFHDSVALLERALGTDLTLFKVPGDQVTKSISGGNYLTGAVHYRDGLWCKRTRLMHKIDSLLTYFTGLDAGDHKRIGFRVGD